MDNYIDFFEVSMKSYGCRKRIQEIEAYLAMRLQQDFDIKYITPYIKEIDAYRGNSQINGGYSNNWSYNPKPELLDVYDLAKYIVANNRYRKQVNITTYPKLGTRMHLDPFNNYYVKSMIRGHEYRHYLAHSLPYNLAFIYGQKIYAKARLNNDSITWRHLALDIEDWLNFERYHGFSRFDEIKEHVEEYNGMLDSIENEKNIYYNCSNFIEERLFELYREYINEMDID